MPASTSRRQKEQLIGMLTELQEELAAANPYVKDFLTSTIEPHTHRSAPLMLR